MYDGINSFNHHNDTDNVVQILSLIQPSLTLAELRDGFGLHQWDVTVDQLLRYLKVDLAQDCLPHTLMKTARASFRGLVRTHWGFDENFAPSTISANVPTNAHTTETLLFCSMPYLVQHIVLHRGSICGDISMLAPREDLEPDYARTLHQPIQHNLTRHCGQRFYRHLYRGVACKDYMGITNVNKKEDIRHRGLRYRVTVSLISILLVLKSNRE